MATVKIKFRPSSTSEKEGTLFYQVIHQRIARQIPTGYKVHPHEWSGARSEIILPDDADESRRHYLLSIKESVTKDTSHLQKIIVHLDRLGHPYTADDIMRQYNAPSEHDSFQTFTDRLIVQLRHIGKGCTADTYTTTLNSFMRFLEKDDVTLDDIDSNLMVRYEGYLKEQGLCPNTTSYYMRNLRAIYNRAVEKELVIQRNPFKHVYTGIDKTVKRAVPLKVVRQIKDLDLSMTPMKDYARDIFMFSFYTRGMSFVDMAYLKKKDLQNGILSYRRHKTNQQLFIKWEKQMQDIIDKYDTSGTPYLLPIIRKAGVNERRQYKSAAHLVNIKLKLLGEQLKLPIPLTCYVARHAWASIAKSKNIAISTISEAMGHESENTTRIYLASLDTSVVDKANSLILKSLQ